MLGVFSQDVDKFKFVGIKCERVEEGEDVTDNGEIDPFPEVKVERSEEPLYSELTDPNFIEIKCETEVTAV